jgi:hypothetical protein
VAERARQVNKQYEAAARRLDTRCHGTAPAVAGAPAAVGPVLTALRAYPAVRGLAFGAYGEASADVHALLRAAAQHGALTRGWARGGARVLRPAQGILASILRRRWGITCVREYARLKLNRLCYVGAMSGVRSAQLSSVAAALDAGPSTFSAAGFQAGAWAH